MSFSSEDSGIVHRIRSQDPSLSTRLQPYVSAQDILLRFGDLAPLHKPLHKPQSAKRRNTRNKKTKPSVLLTLGLVQDMVGYWETRLKESLPRPCGCGREECPVSSDAYSAQHRWHCAIERIRHQLLERRESAALLQAQLQDGASDDDSVGDCSGSDDCGNINSESGESQSSLIIRKVMGLSK